MRIQCDLLQRKPIVNEMTIFGRSVFLYRSELINTFTLCQQNRFAFGGTYTSYTICYGSFIIFEEIEGNINVYKSLFTV